MTSTYISALERGIGIYRSFVGLVVTDAKFDRENHSLIPTTTIRRELKPLDTITDPQTRLGGPIDRMLVVKTKQISVTI
jgi:hypothetical protein